MTVAAWLQRRMLLRWYESGQIDPGLVTESERSPEEFLFALIGPGGTGKTTVLKAAEALIDHFGGCESVRKCAISNTAARLLKGDTIHALCKLPMADFQQRSGRLSAPVLKRHRQRWSTALAVFFDEVSMIAPDQLWQADVRTRQANMRPDLRFGGLCAVLSGDFLQLPPIDRGSLARPLDDAGMHVVDQDVPAADVEREARALGERAQASAESRQGFELWRAVPNVVSLRQHLRTWSSQSFAERDAGGRYYDGDVGALHVAGVAARRRASSEASFQRDRRAIHCAPPQHSGSTVLL